MGLFGPKWNSSDLDKAINAVDTITDEAELENIIKEEAMKKIDNPKIIVDYILDSGKSSKNLIDNINDKTELKRLLDTTKDVKSQAIKKYGGYICNKCGKEIWPDNNGKVPYECKCEVCKKRFTGIIKRGPLQIGGNVLSTGLQSGLNTTEMKLSKKLIESDIENGRKKYFSVDNDAICPNCKARQSWNPIAKPEKPSYTGVYIVSLLFFPLVAMAIWGIFFFDAVIPFIILECIGVSLGIYIPLRSQKKHQEKEMQEYEKLYQQYIDFKEDIEKRESQNLPKIDWSKSKHIPLK